MFVEVMEGRDEVKKNQNKRAKRNWWTDYEKIKVSKGGKKEVFAVNKEIKYIKNPYYRVVVVVAVAVVVAYFPTIPNSS